MIVDDLMAVDNHSLTADELNADVIELCRGIDRLNVVADKLSVLDELTHIDLAAEQRRTSG